MKLKEKNSLFEVGFLTTSSLETILYKKGRPVFG